MALASSLFTQSDKNNTATKVVLCIEVSEGRLLLVTGQAEKLVKDAIAANYIVSKIS
jgi:hypothetical protein